MHLIIFALFIIISHFAWSQQMPSELNEFVGPKKTVSIKDDEYFQKLIQGSNEFGFDLYRQLSNKPGNLVFSPYSIAAGMTMVGVGAQGETAAQIQSVLHFSLNLSPLFNDLNHYLGKSAHTDKQTILTAASAIWLQEGIALLPSFRNALKRGFNYTPQPVNFSQPSHALNVINQWISFQTKGKVNQIISPQDLTRETQFILTTAFYWKGEWQQSFDRRKTVKAPFYYRGHPFQVEMMRQPANFPAIMDEQFALVQIPFKQNAVKLVMNIFLPKQDDDISAWDSKLNVQQWDQWIKQLKSQLIDLFIPKFRVENMLKLESELNELGVKNAFTSSADFSEISNKTSIYLNSVCHKSLLRLEEGGSDINMSHFINSKPPMEKLNEFKIDRPFFFTIQDAETSLILLMGRIVQP